MTFEEVLAQTNKAAMDAAAKEAQTQVRGWTPPEGEYTVQVERVVPVSYTDRSSGEKLCAIRLVLNILDGGELNGRSFTDFFAFGVGARQAALSELVNQVTGDTLFGQDLFLASQNLKGTVWNVRVVESDQTNAQGEHYKNTYFNGLVQEVVG